MRWFLVSALAFGLATADGGMVVPPGAEIWEYGQLAVLKHSAGQEELLLLVRYTTNSQDFAWVVPLPSQPLVDSATTDLFRELADYCRPLYRHQGSGCDWGGGPGGSEHLDSRSGIEELDRGVISGREYRVLWADAADTLVRYLAANGYRLSDEAAGLFAGYIAKCWNYFVVVRVLDTLHYYEAPDAGLRLKFASEKPVYPLRISRMSSFGTDVVLYVLADHRLTYDGAMLRFSGKVNERTFSSLPGFLDREYHLTKLYRYFEESEFEDLVLVQAPDDNDYRHIVYGNGYYGFGLTESLLAVGIVMVARRRRRYGPRLRIHRSSLIVHRSSCIVGPGGPCQTALRSSWSGTGRVLALLLAFTMSALAVDPAYVSSRPASFDSKQQYPKLDPELARSAGLFPELSDFDRLELWQSDSGYVLEVYFKDGRRESKLLEPAAVELARQQLDQYLLSAPVPVKLNQEGRGMFLVSQISLALSWYGVAAALIVAGDQVSDIKVPVAVYLLSASACFFVPLLMTREADMTLAQASLSVGYGARGILAGFLLNHVTGIRTRSSWATITLATSIGGQIAGYHLARRLTPGRAAVASIYADFGALDGFLAGTMVRQMGDKLPEGERDIRGSFFSLVGLTAGGILGHLRATAWDWTEGQAQVISTGGLVGAGVPIALYFALGGEAEGRSVAVPAGLGLAGNIIALYLVERDIKPTPFTPGNGLIVSGTTVGGGLMAAGIGVLTGEPKLTLALAAGGTVAGFAGGIALARGLQSEKAQGRSGTRFELNHYALVGAAAGLARDGSFHAPNLVQFRF